MENAFGQPQNVVLFGGSSDIARAITKRLCAARTHTVILAGRNETLLQVAADEADEYGASRVGTVLFDAEQPQHAAATVREAFEKVEDPVDLVVMAGNVPLFTPEATQDALVAGCARHLRAGGRLVTGFQLGRGYRLADYDTACAAAGLGPESRWSTWDRAPYTDGDGYAVSVHRST